MYELQKKLSSGQVSFCFLYSILNKSLKDSQMIFFRKLSTILHLLLFVKATIVAMVKRDAGKWKENNDNYGLKAKGCISDLRP